MSQATDPSSQSQAWPTGFPRHGGELALAEARFGKPVDGWLDLSTGVNPFAYPVPELPASTWRQLPDASADRALRAAAARAWGVADPETIVAAPGTQLLIQMLPLLRPSASVAVVGPTYPGHADAFAHAGHEVTPCGSLDEIGDIPVAVVVNPNNPDGRRFAPEELRDAASLLYRRGGLLVVDESFADPAPELSVAGAVMPGLLVLRSFGKFFGLAGLRLGFAVATPDLARLLRDALGPWPVGGAALEIGRVALADAKWIAETRRRLAGEADLLDAVLVSAGLAIVGGTPLFRLAGAPRAWALYEHLGKHGILVRPFAEQPRWLRFGLPPDAQARDRLAMALAAWRD
jgi:cobalamin biosynthetic protein CobC